MNTEAAPSITEFLLARIAEEEAQARAAAPWATGSRHEGQPIDWSIHFDRWSPARVLAECAAKRVLVEDWKRVMAEHYRAYWVDPPLAPVVAAFAAAYSDHPDYQQEWAIDGTR